MFCAIPTARVIFMAKISVDAFSLRLEDVWTHSVLGDHMCEMKRVTESGQQGIKTRDHFCCTSTLGEPSPTRNLSPKTTWSVLGPP